MFYGSNNHVSLRIGDTISTDASIMAGDRYKVHNFSAFVWQRTIIGSVIRDPFPSFITIPVGSNLERESTSSVMTMSGFPIAVTTYRVKESLDSRFGSSSTGDMLKDAIKSFMKPESDYEIVDTIFGQVVKVKTDGNNLPKSATVTYTDGIVFSLEKLDITTGVESQSRDVVMYKMVKNSDGKRYLKPLSTEKTTIPAYILLKELPEYNKTTSTEKTFYAYAAISIKSIEK